MKFQEYCETYGVSYAYIAKKTKLSYTTVFRVKSGYGIVPSFATLEKISKLCKGHVTVLEMLLPFMNQDKSDIVKLVRYLKENPQELFKV